MTHSCGLCTRAAERYNAKPIRHRVVYSGAEYAAAARGSFPIVHANVYSWLLTLPGNARGALAQDRVVHSSSTIYRVDLQGNGV